MTRFSLVQLNIIFQLLKHLFSIGLSMDNCIILTSYGGNRSTASPRDIRISVASRDSRSNQQRWNSESIATWTIRRQAMNLRSVKSRTGQLANLVNSPKCLMWRI